jgi:hypothetical protein
MMGILSLATSATSLAVNRSCMPAAMFETKHNVA